MRNLMAEIDKICLDRFYGNQEAVVNALMAADEEGARHILDGAKSRGLDIAELMAAVIEKQRIWEQLWKSPQTVSCKEIRIPLRVEIEPHA